MRKELKLSDMANLGNVIKSVRTETKKTQKQVSDKAGIAITHLSQLENNEKEPRTRNFFNLLSACGAKLIIEYGE